MSALPLYRFFISFGLDSDIVQFPVDCLTSEGRCVNGVSRMDLVNASPRTTTPPRPLPAYRCPSLSEKESTSASVLFFFFFFA